MMLYMLKAPILSSGVLFRSWNSNLIILVGLLGIFQK